ncbi:hypothetical protein I4I77_01180 [Pseudonocardia sp. KRD-188]|uniref:Uncharacterized protein n=1 Tax=Pseudonocardia oceani TaxID=2792013 RepID=A0ABS6UL88_9PSEU|nr:hypothetical protein [Pseudonocardia oceani]MBW0088220.1 hypothetical protein [Pseudonocardia oceani]MBW0131169.1 hypothetical protein [Pseudonocardia oceani]MBW0132569.1 hypothetical protein [Pseudonocardia oceani]
MIITDEMRRAVHEEDCEQLGHMLATESVISIEGRTAQVAGPGDLQPHLNCRRCGKVWLVIEDAGDGYDDAVQRVSKRFKDPADLRIGRRPVRSESPAHAPAGKA